ncbi:anthranilate synthase component I [Chromatiales bacterium (ex Bugula neritina AB1)]|nr:anthranilate synthase component I [Chromatiales bacterium (ex Bugula neritina AB1)]
MTSSSATQRLQAFSGHPLPRKVLTREILADLDTPLSVYLKVANKPLSYLFESVTGGDKWGRYSIIGLPCTDAIKVHGNTVRHEYQGSLADEQEVENPLQWIEDFQARFDVAETDGLPRFTGGLVGYFGYETISYIEPRLSGIKHADPLGTPDILLLVSNEVVVFDNLSGKLIIVIHTEVDKQGYGERRLNEIEEQLRDPLPPLAKHQRRHLDDSGFVSLYGQNSYMSGVGRIKDYITAGDCMQVVLSQRLTADFTAPGIDLYRALRMLNPSPYMYYLELGDHQVVGSSPEILVRLEDGTVTVRPIAGTRPRGATEQEDAELEASLLADPKELAEHLMLIDLGRNDAGRVSETGTVELTEKMLVERYSHVMHIVSNVTGRIKKGMTAMDVIRATFPAGTVSGAPKIRAMEIIAELEPIKRGVYSGAVGYLSWNGNVDTAIAIRTAVLKDGVLSIQAGAGVVYDSDPKSEWDETLNKARAVFRAAAIAEGGLDNIGGTA